MTIQEIEGKYALVNKLHWLKRIKDEYESLLSKIKNEIRYFTITGLSYTARGDEQDVEINPHFSIDTKFVRDGLVDAVKKLDEEIKRLKKEIKE